MESEEHSILDKDIEQIQRKTQNVKTNNVSEAFMANIESIAETVQGFQKMSEDTFKNEAALYF